MYELAEEPCGECYLALLRLAAVKCDRFSLVWRDQLRFNRAAERTKVALAPYLVSETRTDTWPGTTLIGHQAMVRTYRLSDQSLEILEATGSLYAWRAPSFPEDLAFYTEDGAVWLATVSHEHTGWFGSDMLKSKELRAAVPGIVLHHSDVSIEDYICPTNH